jgi:hypothetical protein
MLGFEYRRKNNQYEGLAMVERWQDPDHSRRQYAEDKRTLELMTIGQEYTARELAAGLGGRPTAFTTQALIRLREAGLVSYRDCRWKRIS